MGVKTFIKKYTTSVSDGRHRAKICGGFEFAEHEVDVSALIYALHEEHQGLTDAINEAIKELYK